MNPMEEQKRMRTAQEAAKDRRIQDRVDIVYQLDAGPVGDDPAARRLGECLVRAVLNLAQTLEEKE